jgi:hypothetical protein
MQQTQINSTVITVNEATKKAQAFATKKTIEVCKSVMMLRKLFTSLRSESYALQTSTPKEKTGIINANKFLKKVLGI